MARRADLLSIVEKAGIWDASMPRRRQHSVIGFWAGQAVTKGVAGLAVIWALLAGLGEIFLEIGGGAATNTTTIQEE